MRKFLILILIASATIALTSSCLPNGGSNNGSSDAGSDTGETTGDAESDTPEFTQDDGSTAPGVAGITVTPATITESQTALTNEYFEITVDLQGASEPPSMISVFVQTDGASRDAMGDIASSSGDQVVIENVPYSWLNGLEAGEYSLGARATFSRQSETATDLGTVEIVAE